MTKAMRVKLQRLVFLLAWFVWVSAAWGNGHPDDATGAVLAIGGTASERDRKVVGIAVATAARSAGWRLPRKLLTKQDADELIDCAVPGDPLACVPASIDAQAIHHALIVVVESQQTDSGAPMLVLTGKVIATRPAMLVVHQRFCEHCADEQLAQASTELTLRLLSDLKTATVSATLRVSAPPARAAPRSSGLLPAGLAGAGVGLVAAGTLVYFDQQDGTNDKYRHPRATLVGTAVGLVGVGAIGTAVYLWWRSSTALAPRPAPVIPVINVAPDGGWVGWIGTF